MDQLVAWLSAAAPDVLCMQETKVEDHLFPHGELALAGYDAVAIGQRAYNGVAIAAKRGSSFAEVVKSLPGAESDDQRRLIAATVGGVGGVGGVRVVNVYVPNGQELDSEAYRYKLAWLDRLRLFLEAETKTHRELIIVGDFNVAPDPIDLYDPARWENAVLFTPVERAALRRIQGVGLTDLFRHLHAAEGGHYSWWDYRMSAFKKNRGLRIDLGLATEALTARCRAASIDRAPRALPKPSDHAPIVFDFD
jgi:exodeoxyribonuclease-3